jgi:hypothetical protein
MTTDLRRLHESPPTEEVVLAEMGKTVLSIQPTERLFNLIAGIVIHDAPFTQKNLTGFSPDKLSETFGRIKSRLEKDGINFDRRFLDALGKFIDDRNKLVHRVHEIPGWDLKTNEGRIKAFCFLKLLQKRNSELYQVLLGLVLEYDDKNLYGVIGKAGAQYDLFPDARFYQQVAKEVFGLKAKETD